MQIQEEARQLHSVTVWDWDYRNEKSQWCFWALLCFIPNGKERRLRLSHF